MPRRSFIQTIMFMGVAMLVLVLATGCGGQTTAAAELPPTPIPTPVPTPLPTAVPTLAPERIAQARALIVSYGCIGCHTIESYPEARGLLGPDLSHVASESLSIIASQAYKDGKGTATTAEEYLYESIKTPSLFIAPTCPMGDCPDFVMPRDFASRITDEEIATLVDLLMTLK
ncbi:MAG: hypothetical protein HGB28_00745 [Oscillochloris sp.]|nr:hypothetical protein [Oscillochloris sp.]